MLKSLSVDQFLKMIKNEGSNNNYKRAIIYREIMSDKFTPITLFEALSKELNNGVILESGLEGSEIGKHSFLAFEAFAQLQLKNGVLTKNIGSYTEEFKESPFLQLRQLMKEIDCICPSEIEECVTKSIGFISYDSVRLFEDLPDHHEKDAELPDILFNFYRINFSFNHEKQTLLITKTIDLTENPRRDFLEAQDKITSLINTITQVSKKEFSKIKTSNFPISEVDLSDEKFIALVKRAQNYIQKGDAFQIVLSRRFKKSYNSKPFNVYRALRQISPAPYMFFLPLEDRIIVGASPERMISVKNQTISINPIAGTRKRRERKSDEEIEKELLNDSKELSEHRMLVDLARNDLGKICEIGSLKIESLLKVKHYSHISHLTSMLTGKLLHEHDAFDALMNTFPAGTLSGAPKIRAMEIIDELETSRRGLYGGVIGRMDYAGNFDSCIAIRMAELKDGIATIRTGAGIVFNSDPNREAQETREKAHSILEAIQFSERGY